MPLPKPAGVFLLLLAFAAPGPARAEDAYYLLMFSSQQTPRNPNYSHSFATFVRVGCACPGAPGTVLEAHTISWLPANLVIRTLALLPECGRNYDLDTTIRFALDTRQRVSLWGPYRIEPELYDRAMRQIALLESGKVRYKADDALYRSSNVSNCIHAISGITEGYRLRVLSPGWGDTASYFILLEFMPWIIEPEQTHDWLASALGLDQYPIAYREPPERPGLLPPLTGLRIRDRKAVPTYGSPRLQPTCQGP